MEIQRQRVAAIHATPAPHLVHDLFDGLHQS
jgi:hypothetical protein